MAVGDYGFSISVAGLNAASVVGLDGRVVGVGVERQPPLSTSLHP
jgi:hypothetical protein